MRVYLVLIVTLLAGCVTSETEVRPSALTLNDQIVDEIESAIPVDASVLEAVKKNSQLVTEKLSDSAGFRLTPSKVSVKWLDGFIMRNRKEPPGNLVDILGSFLGESIIDSLGGSWVAVGGQPSVKVNDKLVVFPFAKVAKQFRNGAEDSILYYYEYLEAGKYRVHE